MSEYKRIFDTSHQEDTISWVERLKNESYNQALDEMTAELKKWFENEELNTIIREAVNLRKTIPFS